MNASRLAAVVAALVVVGSAAAAFPFALSATSTPSLASSSAASASDAHAAAGASLAGRSSNQASASDPSNAHAADGTAAASAPDAPEAQPTQGAPPAWASLAQARIHPGIQTFTEGAQCTAAFVFYDETSPGEHDLYIAQAAHCAGTGASTDTNGCTAGSLPLGTKVDLGTGHDGVLAYSSWIAMQDARTPANAPECHGNDFALVRIDPADEAAVSPEVPFFGGPTGIAGMGALGSGDAVYSYGNSGLRLGLEDGLSWKHGNVVAADAWVADVYTATPGIPGDSGSGYLTADGEAFGVLSTVAILPLPLSNQVSGLAPALDYMATHGGPQVALGTAPWTGGIV